MHREVNGHRPKNRYRAPTQGTASSSSGIPLAVTGGLCAARFIAKPLMEVTTFWVGACWLQVEVRGLPRSSKTAFQVLSPARREDRLEHPARSPRRGNSKTIRWVRLALWRLMEQLQDHPLGSTRLLAFNEAASRSPAGIDSPAALAFDEAGDARAWLDTPQPTRSKECEKCRAEVLGTFSARAHRECEEQYGVCDCRRSRPKDWEASVFRQRDASQRPVHKKDMTRDSCCTPHLHHILCSAHAHPRNRMS